jgi:plastocyanin
MRRPGYRAAIVALVATIGACGSDTSTTDAPQGGADTLTSPAGDAGGGGTDVSGMSEFDLQAVDFAFEPDALTGSAGQALTLHVVNAGSATHTFTLDEQAISVTLSAGDSENVDVTFPDSGSVTFYCEFHQASGMEGQLTAA